MIFNLIILFASFSALNLSIYFVVRAFKESKWLYFSLANLVLSFSLLCYALEASYLILDYPHFIWVHAPLLFAIGPLYLFSASDKALKYWWLHLLPAFVMVLWIAPFYFISGAEKLQLFREVHSSSESLQLLSYLYLLHLGIYNFVSYKRFRSRFKDGIKNTTNSSQVRSLWLKSQLAISVAITSTVSFLICFLLDFNQLYTLAVKRYTLALIALLLSAAHLVFSFTIYGKGSERTPTFIFGKSKKEFQGSLALGFKRQVIDDKIFTTKNLTLEALADKLNCSKHELSAFINQEYKLSFNQLINRLRTEEFKRRVLQAESQKFTLLAIAKECGFSSNSSFYRVFKNEEGKTPKEYVADLKSEN